MSKSKTLSLYDILKEYNLLEYFEIQTSDNEIILISKKLTSEHSSDHSILDEIQAEMEKLNITEQDIEEAVQWARKQIKKNQNKI